MQLQLALARWSTCQHTLEDIALILASDHVLPSIKEAVRSDDAQVTQQLSHHRVPSRSLLLELRACMQQPRSGLRALPAAVPRPQETDSSSQLPSTLTHRCRAQVQLTMMTTLQSQLFSGSLSAPLQGPSTVPPPAPPPTPPVWPQQQQQQRGPPQAPSWPPGRGSRHILLATGHAMPLGFG